MKTFRQYIVEAFNKPYPFQLKKKGSNYITIVELPDKTSLEVFFSSSEHMEEPDQRQWEIIFTRKSTSGSPSTELTGEGDQMRIFATVIAAIKEFIKKENPKYMNFSAAKDDKATARKEVKQSREKLYTRLVKKYFQKDYDIESYPSRAGTVWYLERKK